MALADRTDDAAGTKMTTTTEDIDAAQEELEAAPELGKVVRFPAPSPLWLTTEGHDLPKIAVEPGKLHEMATKGEAALIAAGIDVFQRGSMLVRPVIDEVDASKGRKTKNARLVEVSDDALRDGHSQAKSFE